MEKRREKRKERGREVEWKKGDERGGEERSKGERCWGWEEVGRRVGKEGREKGERKSEGGGRAHKMSFLISSF